MLKDISKIIFTTSFGKLFGFLKILLLVNFFGTNIHTDAVIVVMSIFWFWSGIFVYSLFSISLIPALSKCKSENEEIELTLRTVQSVNLLSFVFFIVILTAPSMVLKMFVPFMSDEFFSYASILMRALSPLMILIAFTEIFTILNQYKNRMIVASSNLLIWNLLQAIGFLLSFLYFPEPLGILIFFSITSISGYFLTSLLQLKSSNILGNKLLKLFLIKPVNTLKLIKKNYFFFLSVLLSQLNAYVDNAFISSLEEGFISKYNIIIKVPELAQSILISGISVVFFNKIVEDLGQIKPIFLKVLQLLLVAFIPTFFLVKSYGYQFLNLIYGQNSLMSLGELQIVNILLIISTNVVFMVLISLLIKASVAREFSKYLFASSVVYVLVNFIGNYFLIDSYQLLGIASATLIANLVFFASLAIKIFAKI